MYEYTLDTYDTGGGGGNTGPVPSSITSGVVTTQFYFCPNPADPPDPSGANPRDKFTMSFLDASGNVGFQWGYAAENQVYWRTSSSNPWNYTGVFADATNWDGVKADVDLDSQTFGLDYYDVSANTWSNMIPAGTPLGMSMANQTTLGWQLEDNVFTGTGGKNFFDDFKFSYSVPEPEFASDDLFRGISARMAPTEVTSLVPRPESTISLPLGSHARRGNQADFSQTTCVEASRPRRGVVFAPNRPPVCSCIRPADWYTI